MAKKKKGVRTPKKELVLEMPGKERLPRLLFVAFFLGLVVKLAYLFFYRESPFFEPQILDPAYYDEWAKKILKGDFAGGQGVFYGLPLYPFFLALCYKIFNFSFMAVKLVQAFLGLFTIFFIYKIGWKIHSQKAGIVAAFLAAFYGPLFFHEAMFIPEALSLPLYAMSFYFSLLFAESPSFKRAASLGLLFGLSALTKAGIILFVFLFLAVLLIKELRSAEKKIWPYFACLIFFVLTLLPVTLHNRFHGKDWVPLTSHSGLNFYVGNNPKAEGVFVAPEGVGTNVETQIEDSRLIAEKELGRKLKPSAVSKYWSDKAWDFIKQNPARFLSLSLRKILIFLSAREISDVEDYVFGGNFNPMLRIPWLNFAVIGPLFFVGLVVLWRTRRDRFVALLWTAGYIIGTVAFFVNARYRLPLLSIFIALAAAGIFGIYEEIRQKAWRGVAIYGLVLAAGVGITQLGLVGTDWSRDWVNAGDILLKKKAYDEAAGFYEKALKADPANPKANLAMGIVLTKLARYGEAKEFYLKALDREPNNPQVYNSLGMSYDREGNLGEAKRYFLKALELRPESWQAHNNLGMVYGKMGENEKASEEFILSLKINPESARTNTNLGLIFYRFGRVEEAKRLWERALGIDPDFEEAKRALFLLKQKTGP